VGKLAGKTALVTGGGRGIGRGIVLEFAGEGADVAIKLPARSRGPRSGPRGGACARRRATIVQADVADREAVETMVAQAVDFLGGLDVAVANSGVAARVATVADTDPAEWRRVLATDLDGAFWTARAAIPHVVARKGVFLFISSIGADMTAPGGAPYHVAKAGVNALTKVLAKEVAHQGVRVNCIAPGLVRSDMGSASFASTATSSSRAFPSGGPASRPRSAARRCFSRPPTRPGSRGRFCASTAAPGCRAATPGIAY
jgi:NAD(P)-dependent dehydrogenase (short-subunit alcohol dehydrogenase family)